MASLCWMPVAFANPSFNSTEAGSIQIDEQGSVYNIYAANRSIGAFNSFSNIAGETINSIQASPSDVALYRVIGSEPSQIFGALNANSRVFLVNPNGIVFGPGSQVNAAALVASAANISNDHFLSGNFSFESQLAGSGQVWNQGFLSSLEGGFVALLGKSVRNDGTITTPGGSAILAAGDQVLLSLDGAGLVSAVVSDAIDAPVYDVQGNRVRDLVANYGSISANGGQVILSGRAADQIFDSVINHSGVIEARGTEIRNGRVVLTGERVGLFSSSLIDVSGERGGGSVAIGDEQTEAVYLDQESSILANAEQSGGGGRVIVWSNQSTRGYGAIEADGGVHGGDGGFIETSSAGFLDVVGISLSARAYNGQAGTWLLDPFDVTIADVAPTVNGAFSGANPDVWTPSAIGSTIVKTDVNNRLNAGTNVTITTAGAGADQGNIVVDGAITKSAGATTTLRLQAHNNVVVNQPISGAAGFALNVELVGNSDAAGGGNVDINNTITTHGGNFISSGVIFDNGGGAISTGSGSITINHTGAVTIGANLTTENDIDIDSTASTFTNTAGVSITGGGSGDTFTIDSLGMIINTTAGGALRQTGTGSITLTISGATDITLNNEAIDIEQGTLTLNAPNRTVAGAANDNIHEILADGNITLNSNSTAAGSNRLEINQINTGTPTLTATNSGGAMVFELTNGKFSAFDFTINATTGTIDVTHNQVAYAADVIDINGGGGANTINNVLLSATNASFDYALGAGDVILGQLINTGSSAVNIEATLGSIVDNANDAVLDIDVESLTLTAGTSIGEAAGAGTIDVDASTLTSAVANNGNIFMNILNANSTMTTIQAAAAGNIGLEATPAAQGTRTYSSVSAANGPITITANAGDVKLVSVTSGNDTDVNDISVTATNGDILLGVINAGLNNGDVTLTTVAAGEDIIDINGTTNNITADTVTFNTSGDGDVGTSQNFIEVTVSNAQTDISVGGVGGNHYVCTTGNCDGTNNNTEDLVIENGKITGGDLVDDYFTAVSGAVTSEDMPAADDTSSEDDEESSETATPQAVAQTQPDVEPAAETQADTPVTTDTFRPCQ